MTGTDRRALLVAFALLLASGRCGAMAQVTDEVLAARICVSESRWNGDECRAIVSVLSERAALRGVPVRVMMHSYSPRATGRRPYEGREWIASLHPDRLPRVRRAEHVRVRFASLTVVAWEALRGIGTNRRGAIHWGARYCRPCRERMAVASLRALPWNSMGNVFFGGAS